MSPRVVWGLVILTLIGCVTFLGVLSVLLARDTLPDGRDWTQVGVYRRGG